MSEYAAQMFDADVRIETMLWIPSIIGAEEQCEQFREFCDDLPTEPGHPLYAALPKLALCADEDAEPDPAIVAEYLRFGPQGFIFKAGTPCRKYNADDQSYLSGWGIYYTEWLYAPDEAGIASTSVAWAEGHHARDLEKVAGRGEEPTP